MQIFVTGDTDLFYKGPNGPLFFIYPGANGCDEADPKGA
jgi:hypothetical protein